MIKKNDHFYATILLALHQSTVPILLAPDLHTIAPSPLTHMWFMAFKCALPKLQRVCMWFVCIGGIDIIVRLSSPPTASAESCDWSLISWPKIVIPSGSQQCSAIFVYNSKLCDSQSLRAIWVFLLMVSSRWTLRCTARCKVGRDNNSNSDITRWISR